VLVVDREPHAFWEGAAARHLRRVLAPGGVLLLVPERPRRETEDAVREEFGAHLVRADWQSEPGPVRRPLLCLRAAVAG
jgi:hypothetical protein